MGVEAVQGGVMPLVVDTGGNGGGYRGGDGGRTNAFEAVLDAVAGTDRSDIRGEIRSSHEGIAAKLEGNETRRHAHEIASLDNQAEIKQCIHDSECKLVEKIEGLKNSMLERELDDLKQRNMILELQIAKQVLPK